MLTGREVVTALEGRGSVLEGPWPVRQFLVTDHTGAAAPDRAALYATMRRLMAEGQGWRVYTRNPDNSRAQLVVVVWGDYLNLERSELYEPLIEEWG